MTTHDPTTAAWRPVACPCGRAVLLELMGAAVVLIRRKCRRCGGWWIVSAEDGRVRGADPAHIPEGVGAGGRRARAD